MMMIIIIIIIMTSSDNVLLDDQPLSRPHNSVFVDQAGNEARQLGTIFARTWCFLVFVRRTAVDIGKPDAD